jgi:NhaP-type Na+/H+ and K+/H+ antiporter
LEQQLSKQPEGVKLTLPDGTMILADGRAIKPGAVEEPSTLSKFGREVKSGREAVRVLEKMHRKLGDLPDIPMKMNPIAAIITYSAVGLNNEDIATALGATVDQVALIKDSEAYRQLEQMFDQTVFEDERKNAKHIIARASSRAAQTMVAMVDSEREDIALTAARDVMKIAGINTEEDTNRRQGALRIVVTKSGAKESDLTVEINNG